MHGIDGDGILPGDANMAHLLLDFSKEALAPPPPTKCRGLLMHGPRGSQEEEGKSTRERFSVFYPNFSCD